MEARMMVFQNKTMCLIICKATWTNKYSQNYFVTKSNSSGAVKGEVLEGFKCQK